MPHVPATNEPVNHGQVIQPRHSTQTDNAQTTLSPRAAARRAAGNHLSAASRDGSFAASAAAPANSPAVHAMRAPLSGGDLLKTYDLVILREWTGQAPMTSSGKTIGRDAVVIHVKDVYGGLPAFRHSAHACLMGWSSVH